MQRSIDQAWWFLVSGDPAGLPPGIAGGIARFCRASPSHSRTTSQAKSEQAGVERSGLFIAVR